MGSTLATGPASCERALGKSVFSQSEHHAAPDEDAVKAAAVALRIITRCPPQLSHPAPRAPSGHAKRGYLSKEVEIQFKSPPENFFKQNEAWGGTGSLLRTQV